MSDLETASKSVAFMYDDKAVLPMEYSDKDDVRISEADAQKMTLGDYTPSKVRQKAFLERKQQSRFKNTQSPSEDTVIIEATDYMDGASAAKIRGKREERSDEIRRQIIKTYEKGFRRFKKAKKIVEEWTDEQKAKDPEEYKIACGVVDKGPPITQAALKKKVRELLVKQING